MGRRGGPIRSNGAPLTDSAGSSPSTSLVHDVLQLRVQGSILELVPVDVGHLSGAPGLGPLAPILGAATLCRDKGAVRIFNRATLVAFWTKYPDAEQPLRAWHQEVEHAAWRGPAEVRARYGTADFVANNRVIFDIRGNKYRLVVAVKYGPLHCVYVRFLGTHAEYDRIDPATI